MFQVRPFVTPNDTIWRSSYSCGLDTHIMKINQRKSTPHCVTRSNPHPPLASVLSVARLPSIIFDAMEPRRKRSATLPQQPLHRKVRKLILGTEFLQRLFGHHTQDGKRQSPLFREPNSDRCHEAVFSSLPSSPRPTSRRCCEANLATPLIRSVSGFRSPCRRIPQFEGTQSTTNNVSHSIRPPSISMHKMCNVSGCDANRQLCTSEPIFLSENATIRLLLSVPLAPPILTDALRRRRRVSANNALLCRRPPKAAPPHATTLPKTQTPHAPTLHFASSGPHTMHRSCDYRQLHRTKTKAFPPHENKKAFIKDAETRDIEISSTDSVGCFPDLTCDGDPISGNNPKFSFCELTLVLEFR